MNFFGLLQAIMDSDEKSDRNRQYMMPRVYYYKYLAMAKLKNGNPQEAQKYFNQALSISLSDKIYLPLVQHSDIFDALIEMADRSIVSREEKEILKALCSRQEKGALIIRKAILKDQSPLTPREREVALLVKDRLSAQGNRRKALYI